MSAIYWNRRFELGLPEIDAQHANLIALVNDLSEAVTGASPLPPAATLLKELESYTKTHFRAEEALMAGSPLAPTAQRHHRDEHQVFLRRLAEIRRRGALETSVCALQTLDFLNTWLVAHILGTDGDLARALRGGDTPAQPSVRCDGELVVPPVIRVLVDALSESERRFRMISDHAPAPIWVCDARGHFGFYNRAWGDLTGADPSDAAFDHTQLIVADDRPGYVRALAELLEQRRAGEHEYRITGPAGGEIWLLERVRPRIDGGGTFSGLTAAATDISAIKRGEARLADLNRTLEAAVAQRTAALEALSLTDPLTGIGNRRRLTTGLQEELRRAQRYGRPLAAVFLDLDHFKRVNDCFGHRAGDTVLANVAAALRGAVRDVDVLGRWGGEEFVVLLTETTGVEAVAAAERLRVAIAAVRVPDGDSQPISASIGVAEWRPGESGESLLRRADRALYAAKAAGRDRIRVATYA